MKVLVDYHHADLAESFQLTLHDRYGWDVLIPFGLDWFDQGIWQLEKKWHGDAVAKQYLLGIWGDARPDVHGVVRMVDTRHPGRVLRGITLEAALDLPWDIVISSVPDNAPGFQRFARSTGAAWGIHIGNQWGDEAWSQRPDFAIVTATVPVLMNVPHVVVHQEFDLDIFRYEPPRAWGPMRSFINVFPQEPEYPRFLEIARGAPDIDWDVYGSIGEGEEDEFTRGNIHGVDKIAALMREAGAFWFQKHWGDGFGHIAHNQFAVGRPVFGYHRYYADKLAGPLWVEGETSFDIENLMHYEIYDLIRRLRDDPAEHVRMSENAARRFREVVDFDGDAEKVRELLEDAVMRVAA